ncbi:MAG: hypothetical protein Q7T55_26285 [Solirubrobacteraceae bacterium]|nr:hypothetical protein [Solirubrobacteraceae bacterium]
MVRRRRLDPPSIQRIAERAARDAVAARASTRPIGHTPAAESLASIFEPIPA